MTMKFSRSNKLAMQWALTFLEDRGCHPKSQFVPVRLMPWSSVYRIDTSVGTIYLKQMAPPFAIEARLLLHLGSLFPNTVPEIVGHNEDLRCFLMFDAGIPLRDRLRANYQIQLPIKALTIYATIQQGAIAAIDSLLAFGVPDWGLETLPSLYEELLNKQTFLKEDGLTDSLLQRLVELRPIVAGLCNQLLQYGISETVEHGDFHDNNFLVNEHDKLVINDWGDAVITHPFFSLISFLKSAARNHHITDKSKLYQNLRDAYLTTWRVFESESRLLEAFELAEKLNPIKFSLSFYRVAQCPGMEGLGEYKGTIAQALEQFLNNETKQI